MPKTTIGVVHLLKGDAGDGRTYCGKVGSLVTGAFQGASCLKCLELFGDECLATSYRWQRKANLVRRRARTVLLERATEGK